MSFQFPPGYMPAMATLAVAHNNETLMRQQSEELRKGFDQLARLQQIGHETPCPYCAQMIAKSALLCNYCQGALNLGSWDSIRVALEHDPSLIARDEATVARLRETVARLTQIQEAMDFLVLSQQALESPTPPPQYRDPDQFSELVRTSHAVAKALFTGSPDEGDALWTIASTLQKFANRYGMDVDILRPVIIDAADCGIPNAAGTLTWIDLLRGDFSSLIAVGEKYLSTVAKEPAIEYANIKNNMIYAKIALGHITLAQAASEWDAIAEACGVEALVGPAVAAYRDGDPKRAKEICNGLSRSQEDDAKSIAAELQRGQAWISAWGEDVVKVLTKSERKLRDTHAYRSRV